MLSFADNFKGVVQGSSPVGLLVGNLKSRASSRGILFLSDNAVIEHRTRLRKSHSVPGLWHLAIPPPARGKHGYLSLLAGS